MTDMVTKFANTGKLDFRSFATSVLTEATRIMASRAIVQLLSLAANLFGVSGGGGAGTGVVNGSAGTGLGAGAGGAPIAVAGALNTRQGYGSPPKFPTYTPAPDYRVAAPATASGGGDINMTLNLHMHADGTAKADVSADNQKGTEMMNLVKQAVMQVIVEQKRPGGLLAKA